MRTSLKISEKAANIQRKTIDQDYLKKSFDEKYKEVKFYFILALIPALLVNSLLVLQFTLR